MTVKQIKDLAKASYTKEQLDVKNVNRVAKLLNRSEFKQYIKFLKSIEQQKTVKIAISDANTKGVLLRQLKNKFPGKKLEFTEDKALIAGIKIIDNDNIYDLNLANTLDDLVSYIND